MVTTPSDRSEYASMKRTIASITDRASSWLVLPA
jgi:hypothetical protein